MRKSLKILFKLNILICQQVIFKLSVYYHLSPLLNKYIYLAIALKRTRLIAPKLIRKKPFKKLLKNDKSRDVFRRNCPFFINHQKTLFYFQLNALFKQTR